MVFCHVYVYPRCERNRLGTFVSRPVRTSRYLRFLGMPQSVMRVFHHSLRRSDTVNHVLDYKEITQKREDGAPVAPSLT